MSLFQKGNNFKMKKNPTAFEYVILTSDQTMTKTLIS